MYRLTVGYVANRFPPASKNLVVPKGHLAVLESYGKSLIINEKKGH